MSIFKTLFRAPKRTVTVGLSAAALIASPIIMQWEGVRYEPYHDVGGILTVCYGHTGPDIVIGKKYTKEECKALLLQDIADHEDGVDRYLTADVPDETKAAFISFTFNVGVGAFKNSTLLRKANAGDLEGACKELSRWVFVKRVRIAGLVNRRISERGLCLEGLNKNPWYGV